MHLLQASTTPLHLLLEYIHEEHIYLSFVIIYDFRVQ